MLVASLCCHPQTPTSIVQRVEAEVRRIEDGQLSLRFLLEGALDRVRVPVREAPGIALDLWQHTCCEAFIALDGVDAYHELNLSPSLRWAVFSFEGYRTGISVLDETHAPAITVRVEPQLLELEAVVSLGRLSPQHIDAPLRMGLAAVVEDERGDLSYWALHHPLGVADFHHRDAFALRLETQA